MANLVCPECRGELALQEDGNAQCLVHGGSYQVLFRREAAVPPPAGNTPTIGRSGIVRPAVLFEKRALGECAQHPGQDAFVRCGSCGALVCPTCDFALPGNQHACPKCVASAASRGLSPKRKKMMFGAYGLAVWSMFAFGLSMILAAGPHSEAEQQGIGYIMTLIVLAPSIAGAALGFGALDKRRGNSLALWVAALWNLLLIVGFLMLSLIGLMRG
jgi:uncharacterized protein YbaR (Trm112 family)